MSDFRRRTVIAKKPYDAEIEYLETTGTQWIDTLIVPTVNENTEVIAIVCPTATGSYYFGSNFNLNVQASTEGWRVNGYQTDHSVLIDSFTTISLKQTTSGRYYNINNTTEGYGNKQAGANNFIIGALGGAVGQYKFKGKFRGVIIKENEIVVRDLIPVRIGQVGYMYDKVSGQLFGNSGTGDFVLGEDIVEIEYLETTGTQQIMTNFVVDNTIDIDTSVMFLDLSKQSSICFSFNEENRTCFGVFKSASTNIGFYFGNSNAVNLFTPTVNTKYKFSTNKNILYINDTRKSTLTDNTFVGFTPLGLLQNNIQNIQASFRMYYFKATSDNGNLDFKPVRLGTIGYMYDKVSHQLFGNSGTGNFILGPDL